jgi:hypothetical protein
MRALNKVSLQWRRHLWVRAHLTEDDGLATDAMRWLTRNEQ